MNATELAGKTAVVVGSGRAGAAATRLLLAQGARVRLLEKNPAATGGDWPSGVDLGGDADAGALSGADLLVPSPGVARSHPLLVAAAAAAVPVWSEIELAARFLTCPIVAITGTNGKSTTTVLIGDILRHAGHRVFVGGNLGTPLADAVTGGDGAEVYDYAVAEISSFQLEWIERFRPRVAVWLNLTPDHLDRYAGVDEYEDYKAALLRQLRAGDVAVLNRDDARVWRRRADALAGGAEVFSFGGAPVDQGVFLDGGDAVVRRRDREARVRLAGRPLAGAHNRENMMAAIAAAVVLDVPLAVVDAALEAAVSLPHRLELVAEKGGARWYDDSKATNVGAVEKSIASFAGGVVLLLGGYDKGGDFASLREPIAARVARVVCFGAAGPAIAAQIDGAAPCDVVAGVADAVRAAAARVRPGQTVVLAPGCASFDEFRNYEERGRRFRALVEAL
jgi:UDP-N-acetylmuramoylalanine--D-glutamate ligase